MLATQEAEIKRIMVPTQSWAGFRKTHHKKRAGSSVRVEA
jgi:hypothetical protein